MTAPPYMRTWVDDYLTDTLDLNAEEMGAYWLLLLHAWKHPDCSLPDDDRKLARIARVGIRKWKSSVRPTLERYFQSEDGRLWNRKQRKERAFTASLSEENSRKARKRWDKQGTENKQSDQCRSNAGADAAAMPYPDSQNNVSPSGDTRSDDKIPPPEAPPPVDLRKEVFDLGTRVLASANYTDDGRRRSIIGSWRRTCGNDDARLLAALGRCAEEKPVDPVPWITASLQMENPRYGSYRKPARDDDKPRDPHVRVSLERQAGSSRNER